MCMPAQQQQSQPPEKLQEMVHAHCLIYLLMPIQPLTAYACNSPPCRRCAHCCSHTATQTKTHQMSQPQTVHGSADTEVMSQLIRFQSQQHQA